MVDGYKKERVGGRQRSLSFFLVLLLWEPSASREMISFSSKNGSTEVLVSKQNILTFFPRSWPQTETPYLPAWEHSAYGYYTLGGEVCSPELKEKQKKKIINSYWTRLSKISCFVSCERINYLTCATNHTDKSRYFAITEFNDYFNIQSPSLFFDKYLRQAAIFTQYRAQEGEKRAFI